MANFPEFRLRIVGRKVTSVDQDSFGFGIWLEGGWSIRIHGELNLRPLSGQALPARIIGSTLLSFAGDERQELLAFDSGVELTVKLDGGSTAESMIVNGPQGLIVVWE